MNHRQFESLPRILRDSPSSSDAPITERTVLDVAEQLAQALRGTGAARPPAALHPAAAQEQYAALSEEYPLAAGLPRYPMPLEQIESLPPVERELHELAGLLVARTVQVVIPQRDDEWLVLAPTMPAATPLAIKQLLAARVLAQATALLGAPLRIDTDDVTHPTLVSWARHIWSSTDDTVLCLPCYDWEQTEPQLTAVVIAQRSRLAVPLTDLRWWQWFAQDGEAAVTSRFQHTPAMRAVRPLVAAGPMLVPAWDTHISVLRRATIPWLPPQRMPQPQGMDPDTNAISVARLREVEQWLGAIMHEVGVPAPTAEQCPAILKRRLQQVMTDHEAERLSSSAETTARSLRDSASATGRTHTNRAMVEQLRGLLDTAHYPFTAFASYFGQGMFALHTALDEPLAERENLALTLAVQCAVLGGAPTFVAPDVTPTPVHALIRTVLESADGLLVMPVYSWRSTGEPMELFGAFVAVRDGAAPPPEAREIVQWNLVCQAMDAPLCVLALERDPAVRQATLTLRPSGTPAAPLIES